MRPPDSHPDTPLPVRVITFGTYDLFHIGHLNLLRRARSLGTWLIVGVSSDELNQQKKGHRPVFALAERLAIVRDIRWVDEVFVEESLELKAEYIQRYRADVLVMGDDWRGRFDHFSTLCRVAYLPRTPEISTTQVVTLVRTGTHG